MSYYDNKGKSMILASVLFVAVFFLTISMVIWFGMYQVIKASYMHDDRIDEIIEKAKKKVIRHKRLS